MCCSFPLATVVVFFAARYRAAESESASMLLVSTLALALTVPAILWSNRCCRRGLARATITHLSAILTFLIGVFLSALPMHPIKACRSWPSLSTVMTVEIILILLASLAVAVPRGTEIFVVSVSLALGLQNGTFRRTGGISVHTTYMTGLITGLIASEVAERPFSLAPPEPQARDPKTILLYGLSIAFILGAAMGAAMVFRFREFGILGTVLILFAIVVCKSTYAAPMHDAT
jgi:uncharacterized membrane protein YoaK (UPF0700 family)